MTGIRDIGFDMLPRAGAMVGFSDKLVLYDNLDFPLSEAINPDVIAFLNSLPRRSSFTIVILCVKGRIEFRCNLRNISAGPGELIVIVPGTVVEEILMNPDSKLIVIAVSDQTYLPDPSFQNAMYAQQNFTSSFVLPVDKDILGNGIESYKQLKNAIVSLGDKATDDLIQAYILVMAGLAAISFQKILISRKEKPLSAQEKALKDFYAELERSYVRERSVAYYAEKAGLSPRYFSKLVFNASGKHPMELIKEYVILNAKAMLKSGSFSIGQICEALNFSGRAQFNKYFKDETGMTPSEYLKASQPRRRNP